MKNLFILSLMLLFPCLAAAQSSSLFPSGSSSGGSSSRTSTSSSMSGGSSSRTSGSSGGSAASGIQQSLGGGGAGGQGGGSGSTFGTGELTGPAFTQFGQAGQAAMDTEFVGVGQTGTFVGVEQTAAGGEQMQNRQSLQGLGNRGDSQSQGRSTSSGRSRAARLQPVVRLSFAYQPIAPAAVQSRIETRIADYQFDVEAVGYSLDADGVLTLTGVAASEEASKMLATFLSFEPGVRRIDNQIVVNQ